MKTIFIMLVPFVLAGCVSPPTYKPLALEIVESERCRGLPIYEKAWTGDEVQPYRNCYIRTRAPSGQIIEGDIVTDGDVGDLVTLHCNNEYCFANQLRR